MSVIPPDVLSALGRLNAHARGFSGLGTERNAIYAYKTLAALLLIERGEAEVRFVRLTTKCNRCSDGWYYPWWSEDKSDRSRCRYCSCSMKVTLRFTETTLPDGQVWHHPWEGQSNPGFDLARAALKADDTGLVTDKIDAMGWQEPGSWAPQHPAVKLDLPELVALLNQVETWVAAIEVRSDGACWWTFQSAKRYLTQSKHRGVIGEHSHAYRLDLGEAPGGCFVCNTTDDLAGFHYGRLTPLFHWSLPVCKRHGEGPDKAAHPKDPPPDVMIFPALREWLARHERVVEAV